MMKFKCSEVLVTVKNDPNAITTTNSFRFGDCELAIYPSEGIHIKFDRSSFMYFPMCNVVTISYKKKEIEKEIENE